MTVVTHYSHDYPDDTTLTYVKEGDNARMFAAFTSEDPDCGTEELEYGGIAGETREELIKDWLAEISDYLDRHEVGEPAIPDEHDGIYDLDDYYGEFTRTALYAVEAALINELK